MTSVKTAAAQTRTAHRPRTQPDARRTPQLDRPARGEVAQIRRASLARWHKLLATHGFGPPVAHAPHMMNLAPASPELYEGSQNAFAPALLRGDELQIPCLVIHPVASGERPIDAAIRTGCGCAECKPE